MHNGCVSTIAVWWVCRALNKINDTCTASFAVNPVEGASCIDNGAHALSVDCLAAYAEFLDFPTEDLQAITEPYTEIHQACFNITDKVCSASSFGPFSCSTLLGIDFLSCATCMHCAVQCCVAAAFWF